MRGFSPLGGVSHLRERFLALGKRGSNPRDIPYAHDGQMPDNSVRDIHVRDIHVRDIHVRDSSDGQQ